MVLATRGAHVFEYASLKYLAVSQIFLISKVKNPFMETNQHQESKLAGIFSQYIIFDGVESEFVYSAVFYVGDNTES